MDRQDVLKRLLYPKCKTAIEFQFDNLIVNPMLSYITVQDIAQLNKIATSLKYSSKPKEKYIMIDKIMTNRGFRKMASGTNRVTYRCLNDYRVVLKIAIDKVGLSDNGNEYRNQQLLKPFVTKCFEVSPCGTVGLFERVVPITSREEFINISDDIFDLINNLIGKYVLEDIGEKFYMNYGLREGFGPVLLDYPYVFELDGKKLICNVPEPLEPKGYCGGEIDYDLGYNDLVCKKCGKRYLATELKSDDKSGKVKIIIEGEDTIMKCVLKRGDEVVSKLNSEAPVATNTIKSKRDFVKLKAQITKTVSEEKDSNDFKPTIKTHDDVQLRARLRGHRSSKDIDKEAREKEAIIERNSEKMLISFDSLPEEKPLPEVSDFSVILPFSKPEKEEVKEENKDSVAEIIEFASNSNDFNETENYTLYTATDSEEELLTVVIKNEGEIWNIVTNKLIGYTTEGMMCRLREEYDVEVEDGVYEYAESVESELKTEFENSGNNEIAYADSNNGTTIGEILQEKLSSFKGNKNYKTNDIVSPIESYFSANEPIKSEEETPVEESSEFDDEYYGDDYDPEYSGEEESLDEEERLKEY